MGRWRSAALALGSLLTLTDAWPQDDEESRDAGAPPEIDFLEYLGSWPTGDDEWLVLAEWEANSPDQDAQDTDDADEIDDQQEERNAQGAENAAPR